MVIHFLQHEGVLPVLQELHKSSERPSYIVEGYNTWFQEDPVIIAEFMNNRSDSQVNDCLSKLWVKFLRYYTEDFNFERDVVQCQMSGRLSLFEKEWTSKCISIEDPFDHNHNLGAGVSRKMANFIISVLRRARHVFGSFDISMYTRMIVPHMAPDLNVEIFCDILLSKALLTNGEEVPNDRCCRICGKIGHFIKGNLSKSQSFLTIKCQTAQCQLKTVVLLRKMAKLWKLHHGLASFATKWVI